MSSSHVTGSTLVAFCSILLLSAAPVAQTADRRNLILITLDGARTQEIFGGLDVEVLRAGLKKDERLEDTRAYQRVLGGHTRGAARQGHAVFLDRVDDGAWVHRG